MLIILALTEFIGRFHPLLVHLPIGFLLIAILFSFLSHKEKFASLGQSVSIILFIGTISAILACITGYLLSINGDYNDDALSQHKWTGIITAAVSLFAWLISSGKIHGVLNQNKRLLAVSMLSLLVLITVAGHLGGNLTHGEGYLTAAWNGTTKSKRVKPASLDSANVYADIIAPILEDKCGNCHNDNKKKGKLSMEEFASLMKGGKHGIVVKPGDPNGSELIKRVMLDPKDKEFMPTDGKPPLTDKEKLLIRWWIDKTKASEDISFAKASVTDDIKLAASSALGFSTDGGGNSDSAVVNQNKYFTQLNLPALDTAAFSSLRAKGWVFKMLNYKPDLVDARFPASQLKTMSADDLKELLRIKDHIIWLNISANQVQDAQMVDLSQFQNLQRLRLEKNPISDAGIARLKNLKHLESINLVSTSITNQSIATLSEMASINSVYVWQTPVKKSSLDSTRIRISIVRAD